VPERWFGIFGLAASGVGHPLVEAQRVAGDGRVQAVEPTGGCGVREAEYVLPSPAERLACMRDRRVKGAHGWCAVRPECSLEALVGDAAGMQGEVDDDLHDLASVESGSGDAHVAEHLDLDVEVAVAIRACLDGLQPWRMA